MSEEIMNPGSEGPSVAESATVATPTSAPFNFKDHLSSDLKDNASLKDFKDIDGLAKSYINAQAMIGKSVRIPGPDASAEAKAEFYGKLTSIPGVVKLPDSSKPEEVAAFHRLMGAPESPDKYDISLPEGFTLDGYEATIAAAHKAGVTKDQMKALMSAEIAKNQAALERHEKQRIEAEKIINSTFGSDKEARIAGAQAAARIYAEKFPDQVKELLDGPSGNNPVLIMLLSDLGRSLQEKGHSGMASTAAYGIGPMEALEQIKEIRSNTAHPYFKPSDPNHKAAKEKMDALYKIAYAGK